MKLPSVRGATQVETTAASSDALSSPTCGINVINMDAAKRSNNKRSFRKRGQSVTADGKIEMTADEALKLYYDKMATLELKLKNDMEIMRRRRQGLLVSKKSEVEESENEELN